MKVIPINKLTNNNTFKGLWEKPKERVIQTNLYSIKGEVDNKYHPFADETEASIKEALASKRFEIWIPTVNNLKVEDLKSEPVECERLPFMRSEYAAYKNYYGKNMPEIFQKIELSLTENNLSHLRNNRLMSFAKRILHKLRVI